jgi:hypothetical protein
MNLAAVDSYLADRGDERANEGSGGPHQQCLCLFIPTSNALSLLLSLIGVGFVSVFKPQITILLNIINNIVMVDGRAVGWKSPRWIRKIRGFLNGHRLKVDCMTWTTIRMVKESISSKP